VNTEEAMHKGISCHQNSGEIFSLLVDNKSFENMEKFKYFGTKTTNQNWIHEKIKSRLNSGNACHHSVQNLFGFLSPL
jgi:hypothetical protein